MTDNEPTTRDLLEAAFDDVEKVEEPAALEAPTESPAAEAPAGETARDEQGRFAPKAEEAQEVSLPEQKEPAQEAITPGPKPGPRAPEERAPASWSPEVRQHWQALPPDVRQEVYKREREVQQTLQESAEARKTVESFSRVIAPYEAYIRAENSNPLQAVDNLMATAVRLRTANGPELADLVAGIVQQFGLGRFGQPFIEQLDTALASKLGVGPQAPGQPAAVPQLQQALQQELAPIRQFMSQIEGMKYQREQQATQQAAQSVEQFLQQAEFGQDVREEMADILEISARRGRDMTLEQAYNQAVRLHPTIGKIVSQREQAPQGVRPLAQRKIAASSVSGSAPMGAPQQSANDIRSAIENAIEANSR
jgi:hypothetical protein